MGLPSIIVYRRKREKKGEIRKERENKEGRGELEKWGTEKERKDKRVTREREAEREKKKKSELRGRSCRHCAPRSRRRRSAAILAPVAAAVGDEARRRHSRLYRRQNYTPSLESERRCNHHVLSSTDPPPFESRTGEHARRKLSRSCRRRRVDGLAVVLLAWLLHCRSSSSLLAPESAFQACICWEESEQEKEKGGDGYLYCCCCYYRCSGACSYCRVWEMNLVVSWLLIDCRERRCSHYFSSCHCRFIYCKFIIDNGAAKIAAAAMNWG
ncbi:uncharacterized protein [Arachis hypogaea]|uniref:uncharacterized protein n=1 Tax=Arachis hypogaea TaxID=3818 RepID=UPI000DED303B|nr:uncharacterized protein LOC112756871 [Arachis hypogaea]